ncbi:hypothetical protein GOC91_04340 [Sinorhizobium medicae]|uniref:hypothetical protein n=1 Tax=Sinorhizobium medicae TaxID=110321 RepID=UPI0012978586|nr:hypothetical protein [Sinorhizobium medicae]UFX02441.1 hypothetical protein SmedWSM1115_01825 [Sinorhizobium medicae WSM1115]MBO1939219.1 hypothetical protein [Sinorhizobium medicae]MBO1963550.1 hypothetical protein [Sinorhizobium medicae]MDX0406186.1 hypothetical protein [Sinorhizobium medicae]MDX0412954.1 hypothetical protein [Sinorhizobium medicae]
MKEHHHGHDGNGIAVRYGFQKPPMGRTVRAPAAEPPAGLREALHCGNAPQAATGEDA